MAWGTVPGTGNLLMSSGDLIKTGITQTQTLTSFSVGSTVTVDGQLAVSNVTRTTTLTGFNVGSTVTVDGMLDVGASGKGGPGDIANTGKGLFGSLVKVEEAEGVDMGFSLSATNSGARDFRWLQKGNDRWAFTDEDDAEILIQLDRTVPDLEFKRAIGGLVVGDPSGGSQGSGTLNAEELHDDDNTLCAPVEEYLFGKSDLSKWHNVSPKGENELVEAYSDVKSWGYDGSLKGFQTVLRSHQSVPGLYNFNEIEEKKGRLAIGDRIGRSWLAIDILGVSLDQLIEENKKLKSRINSLEALYNDS